MVAREELSLDRLSFYPAAVDVGSVVYPPGGHYGPRTQQNVQLVVMKTGSVHIRIDDNTFTVPAGHVALLLPGHDEEFTFAPHHTSQHEWIHLAPEKALDEASLSLLRALPKSIPLSDAMVHLMESMLALARQVYTPETQSLLRDLGLSGLKLYGADATRRRSDQNTHPSVLTVKSYIHTHYAAPLRVRDFAAIANISPEHLIRLFRQHEHTTPARYLWDTRVRHAIELIRHSGLTLDAIAEQTGFGSLYHLSRRIKAATGQSPTQLRVHRPL